MEIVRKKETKNGLRVWWRCKECATYGDISGTESLVLKATGVLAAEHSHTLSEAVDA